MAEKLLIKFKRRYTIYNGGEIAGFDLNEYQRIIKAGVGVPYDPNEKEPEPEAADVSHEAPEPETTNDLLEEKGAVIKEKIAEKGEDGYLFSPQDLQALASRERTNKNRSTIIKAIENEIVRRIEESAKEAEA